MDNRTKLRRTDRVIASSLDDEIVMFDAENGKYYGLNNVAAAIWNSLEEEKSIIQLCESLSETFDITEEKCREEVIDFLPELQKKGLIEIVKE
ncbi:MAG: PqqD family peptide modification chaperone [Balneolaceae bacterium]|nr:PqqD family peptide modification chaperone [Balneolaceae bacterium]